jgi:periplasmic protein TonB
MLLTKNCMRKYLVAALIGLMPVMLIGQTQEEKFFFDAAGNKCDSVHASTYSVYIYSDSNKKSGKIITKNMRGVLISDCDYIDIYWKRHNGKSMYYFEDGSLKQSMSFIDGEYDGELLSYYSNGQLKRKDQFNKGKFISGNCYTKMGNDTSHYQYEIMPEYPGGEDALIRFISSKLKYPKKARKAGIQGKVLVKFSIDKMGKVTDVGIAKSVDTQLDKEGIRIVKSLARWSPGRIDGESVKVSYVLPINFKMQ